MSTVAKTIPQRSMGCGSAARLGGCCALVLLIVASVAGASEPRPNILWITLEDISTDLGCYGVDYADTPNIDRLAEQGVRFTRAWSNAGMCAPARATLITGMYPPGTGAQNMRSSVRLPEFIHAFPEYLRHAGYYTSNHVKTDYNWDPPQQPWTVRSRNWMEDGWKKRADGQPFFTVINITDTHSSQLYWRGEKRYRRRAEALGAERLHDPAQAPVPPYYPDTPEVRTDLARYHDNITYADQIVGRILNQLEADGLAEDTIVFLFSDHGRGMPRTKGWCFYSSLRVPLIVRFPQKFADLAPQPAGQTEDRLVSFVDFGPTVLSLAGIEPPSHMNGVAFLGRRAGPPRELAFAYRDRMDERFDLIRSVWDGRYHYIRNSFPHLPWFHEQTRDYPHTQPTYEVWHRLKAEGKLQGDAATYMAHRRPAEMLFDTKADPHELRNLAGDPQHAETLERLRAALHSWQDEVVDLGFMPEALWFEQFEDDGDLTPRHTLVREQPELYPLARLRELADALATDQASPEMFQALASENPAVRFWGTLGLLASGDRSEPVRDALRPLLQDETATVRATAAQALAAAGETDAALPVLLKILDHEQPFVALRAANGLDHLGEAARPVLPELKRYLESHGASGVQKQRLGATYPNWVLGHTVERLESAAP